MSMTFTSKHGAARYFPILKVAGDAAMRAPVALTKAVCIVGRHLGVHLPLANKQVSKLHALIVKERDRVYIRDLASRNHLLVNDQPVREADLGTGDVVRVGPYALHCASGFAEPDLGRDAGPRAPAASLELNGGVSRVALEGRAILIGGREECDVVLADERVSSIHAVIFELDGKRFIRDLGTMVGTYRNGDRIHQEELTSGDELRIGGTRLRYVEEAAAVASPVGGDVESDVDLDPMDREIEAAVEDAESEDRVTLNDHDDTGEARAGVAEDLITMAGDPEDGPAAEDSLHAGDELVTLEADPDDAPLPPAHARAEPEERRRESAEDTAAAARAEQERKAPPGKASNEVADTVPAESPADEKLIPLVGGDRAVGVIDAAVESSATGPHGPAMNEDDLTESATLAHLPLMSVSGSDAAVGGLPLPAGAAAEGYGHFDDDEVTPAELGIKPHKPISPEETIMPDSGPDLLAGEPPKPPTPADPAHPLFELVREFREALPGAGAGPRRAPDEPRTRAAEAAPVTTEAAGPRPLHDAPPPPRANDPRDLADLLKYDGADATFPARGSDAPGDAPKDGRRSAVRKLDRLVHELSDRVAELKSTWRQVKQARPAGGASERPPTSSDDADGKRDASPD